MEKNDSTIYDDIEKLCKVVEKCPKIFEEGLDTYEHLFSKLKDEFDQALIQVSNNCEHLEKELNSILDSSNDNHRKVEKLEMAGLTGTQLKLKVKVKGFDLAYNQWELRNTFINLKNFNFKKILLYLLKWLNTILGSLTSVFPICESIKEFKECIENVISFGN